MRGICYIVGAGDFSRHGFTPTEGDLVIAADGGYDALVRRGIRCDLLVGDLDSISEAPTAELEVVRHPVRKDETDMHLAYLEGARRGYTDFRIYGATGGRADHTFANYCLLLCITEQGHAARILSDTGAVFMIKNGKIGVSGKAGTHLSLFPFGGRAGAVTVKGAEYECESLDISPDFPVTASNRFLGGAVIISVERGALLVMCEDEFAEIY